MNKKVILIEPQSFLIPIISQICQDNQDEIYIISNQEKYKECKNFIIRDIRSQIELIKMHIKENIGQPDAVITTSEMFLTQAAELASEFGVLRDSSASIVNNRDKSRMKQIWIDQGLTTPKSKFFKSKRELLQEIDRLEYPVIIKPSLGYASCGVRKVENTQELLEQLNKILIINSTVIARERLDNIGFMVEEYIEGEEYSIDTIWFDGTPICNGIMSKGVAKGPYFPDRLYYVDPYLTAEKKQIIVEAANNAVKATGCKYGATHTELRLKNNIPYLIESTCRPGAGAIFYYIFEMAMGIDFYNIFYHAHLAKSIGELRNNIGNIMVHQKEDYYFWYNMPYPNKGVLKDIKGLEEIQQLTEVIKVICFKEKGSMLYEEDMNSDYFCWVIGALNVNIKSNQIHESMKKYDDMLQIGV